MDRKTTTRRFFSHKSDRSPSKKPQFDMRTVLFKADHLKASTTRSAPVKAYKFFSSKNQVPSHEPPAPNLQSNVPVRSAVRNGASSKSTSSLKKTRSENTENLTVAQSKASGDRSCRSHANVQPVKQSKRIRAEDPDPVDPSVITGRRSLRSDRTGAREGQEPVRKKVLLDEGQKSPEQPVASSPEPQTSPSSDSSLPPPSPPSVPPVVTQTIPEISEMLPIGEAAAADPTPEPQSQVAEPADEPKPPILVKPRKKFFTSKNSVSDDDNRKNKRLVDHKKFFKPDFEDSFVETKAASSETEPIDEYVTMQRVRKAHQCHEMGETESFDEDIRYNLNGLEKANTSRIRCLSIEALTAQCMTPEFRMHLRAHDDMPRIISALSDAPSDPNLAFCTAVLMFVYNQDRLTMDIDPNHLRLMLDLLEVKEDETVEKAYRLKAKELVEQMKSRGHGKFLDPKNLSAGKLALEALLGLTSKRAGDWFKEELRKLKGLDFLMNTVISISRMRDTIHMESEMTKVDRTLRVLEAATFMHEDNQLYTIQYEDGSLIRSCTDLLKLCKDSIIFHTDSKVYLSALLSVLRVFTNVTSESGRGSQLMGSQFDYLLNLFLDLLFEVPSFVLPDARFDLMVLLLCLCINLIEYHEPLRGELLQSQYKMKSLVDILMSRVAEAKETEQQADDLLETAEKDQMTEIVNIDTLLNQVVAKSGKHMEHSIIAACVSLLLGCTIQDNEAGKQSVTDLLPDGSFEPLIDVLRKLHEFAHLADIMTPSGVKRVEKILRVFQSPTGRDEVSLKREPSSPSLMSISESFLNDTDTTLNQTANDSISF